MSSEPEFEKVIVPDLDKVTVIILPDDDVTRHISEDSISLDGDSDHGGKGLPPDDPDDAPDAG